MPITFPNTLLKITLWIKSQGQFPRPSFKVTTHFYTNCNTTFLAILLVLDMVLFGALYRRKCCTLICWDEMGEIKLLEQKIV
jgi:hypothetical protein